MAAEGDQPEVSAPGSARREIEGLVQRLTRNLDLCTRRDYKETQVRVERMLDLHKKLSAATIPADKKLYQRQIETTDEEIDALVHELYGLTEEEIAIVEGAGSSMKPATFSRLESTLREGGANALLPSSCDKRLLLSLQLGDALFDGLRFLAQALQIPLKLGGFFLLGPEARAVVGRSAAATAAVVGPMRARVMARRSVVHVLTSFLCGNSITNQSAAANNGTRPYLSSTNSSPSVS